MDERELACCVPHVQQFPSGKAFAHDRHCRARDEAGRRRRLQRVNVDEWIPVRECPTHAGQSLLGCMTCEAIAETAIQGDAMWEVVDD